jgi:hypothetical protein
MAIKADIVATNVLTYKRALSQYMATNTTFTGSIPDAAITMPTGMAKNPNWSNAVSGGQLVVFELMPSSVPGLLETLYQKSGESLLVGRSNGAMLINAHGIATGVTVPTVVPAIPTGSIVLAGN